MPASRSRSTTRRAPRRSPRRAPLPSRDAVAARPSLVPFAGVFGLLVAAEEAYFVWLLSFGWYLVVPLVLALATVTGVLLVWWGRRRAWVLLAVSAVLPLLGLLALALLFGYLGGGLAFWSALLLLVGPVGCLVLTLQRPVRRWSGAGTRTPSPGGRRAAARSG